MDTKLIDPSGFAGASPVSYRTPPHNEEAEQTVLGAILVNNKAFEKVGEFLRPEHFFDPVNQKIYQAILKMIDRGQVANPITLKAYFEQDRDLSEIGGPEFLARLAAAIVTVHNLEDYGHIIHDAYLRRQLIEVGEDMVNQAYKHDIDIAANDQIEDAEKKLFELAATGDIKGDFIPFDRALTAAIATAEAAFRRSSHVTGVTSGLRDLDTKLGGLHPSDLLILAGRPSMGKTALATNIAFNAAKAYMLSGGKEGAPVGFFSLEMSAEQLALRILADQAEVSGDKIRRGEITAADFPKFVEASQYLARVPFFVDDTPALTITAVRTRARRLKRTHGLGQAVGDVVGGRLAVDRGRQGQDHLGHRPVADPRHQLTDPQAVRPHAVQRRQQAAQHVVAPLERAAALHGPDRTDLLDHAQQACVAGSIDAYGAGIGDVQRAARPTGSDLFLGVGQGGRQWGQQGVALLQQGQGRTPARARAQPRQLGQQGDQAFDLGSGGGGHQVLRLGGASPSPFDRLRVRGNGRLSRHPHPEPVEGRGWWLHRFRTSSRADRPSGPPSDRLRPASSGPAWRRASSWRRRGRRRSGQR